MNDERTEAIRHDAKMDEYRDTVVSAIKEWFLSHYEDPAERTPYDSSEGGYLYQLGGPYYARDILHDHFSEDTDESVIEEAIEELESMGFEWERIPTLEDFNPDDIASKFSSRFMQSMGSIKIELSKFESDPFMCSLLFAHTITSLEAYLSDAFITCIENPKHFTAFIESDPDFKKQTITVSEIYKKTETLQSDVLKRIQSIVFHRLPIVQQMYRGTLRIEFPSGMKDLMLAIKRRHDIIHRGCRDLDGVDFEVTKAEVQALLLVVETFVTKLDGEVSKVIK